MGAPGDNNGPSTELKSAIGAGPPPQMLFDLLDTTRTQ